MMRRWAIVVACVVAAAAAADEFRNKKSGEIVVGKTLGKVTLEGKSFFLVKTGEGMKRLPIDEWVHTLAAPPPTPPKPGTAAEATPAPDAEPAPEVKDVEYRGKARTAEWVSKAMGVMRQQALEHDGRFWNTCDVRPVERRRMGVGECFEGRGKAIRVLENGQVLATMVNGQRVAIEGMKLVGVVGDRKWEGYLVAVGTYEDEAEKGDERTVLRCVLLQPLGSRLTHELFLQGLKAGVPLVSRETCPACGGRGYTMRGSRAVPGAHDKVTCGTCKGDKAVLVDLADGRPRR